MSEPGTAPKARSPKLLGVLTIYSIAATGLFFYHKTEKDGFRPEPGNAEVLADNGRTIPAPPASLPEIAVCDNPTDGQALALEKAKDDALLAFYGRVQEDPRAMWELLQKGGVEFADGKFWRCCAACLVALEGRPACEEIFALKGPWSGAARSAALLTLAANSLPDFLDFSKTHPAPASASFARRMALELSRHSPEAAAEWSLTLPPSSADEAIAEAATAWIRADPHRATEWLSRNRESFPSSVVIERCTSAITDVDPVAGLAWAAELTDPGLRADMIETVLPRLAAADPAAAKAWLEGQTALPETGRSQLAALLREEALHYDDIQEFISFQPITP